MCDSAGNLTTKTYDKLGRLESVTSLGGKTTYAYDTAGRTQTVTNPNGTTERYTYDKNNQLTTLENRQGETVTDRYVYTYDDAGNQLTKTETVNGVENATASFAYDALGRLSTAEERDGKRYAYEYDASGNRTSTTVRDRATNAVVKSESYSYDARNRMEMYMDPSGMPLSVSYDANGNVTEDQNGGYVYDAFNRLTTHVEFQSGQYKETHYAYNGDGQRVSKTDANNASTYYQYEYDKVVLERKSTGEVTRNTYGINLISRSTGKVQEKSLNANMSVKVSYNETLYYQYNGHADVTRLSDASGIEKASYTYDAFGNALESTGTENNPYRYAGYTYDEESSLYYLNARYYNPKTARLQAVDPHWNSENMIYGDNPRTINTMQNPIIEQSFVTAEIEPYVVDEELKVLRIKTNENVPEQGADQRTEQAEKQDGITVPDARAIIQSSNLYVYCGNDPIRYTDPSGETSEQDADQIIKDNATYIKDAAKKYGVDPAIVAGCIYAEQVLNVSWVDKATDWTGAFGTNTSIGIGQVRMSTAKFLETKGYVSATVVTNPKYGQTYGENSARADRLKNNKENVMYVAAYLKYFQDTWKGSYKKISNDAAVLGTLYNIGHENTKPNSNPQSNSFGDFVEDNYDHMNKLLGI